MECADRIETKVNRRIVVGRQIPERLNLVIVTIVLFIYLSLFFGASLLAGHQFCLFALVILGFLISTPTIWGLAHEGIHGRLLGQPFANRTASRLMCVLLGFSFDAVQFGHLMHHRYNGHQYDRPDRAVDVEPAWKTWARHWVHLLGGHYLFTALVSMVAFGPARLRQLALQSAISGPDPDMVAMRDAALKWFSDPQRIDRIRIDCTLSVLLIFLAMVHYAVFWPILVFALYARAFLYSTLDNLPHYGVEGRGDAAAKNLSLPRWASFIVLHHNLHRVHHEHPNLPWRDVPANLAQAGKEGNYLLAAIRQFSGPTGA
jgi:fatty acid desaturase